MPNANVVLERQKWTKQGLSENSRITYSYTGEYFTRDTNLAQFQHLGHIVEKYTADFYLTLLYIFISLSTYSKAFSQDGGREKEGGSCISLSQHKQKENASRIYKYFPNYASVSEI